MSRPTARISKTGFRPAGYAIVDGRTKHYSASAQVFADGEGRCRFVWIIDLLPNELAGPIGAMQAQGAQVLKDTLERKAVAA